MRYDVLDDVLAELANRFSTNRSFGVSPALAGKIIGDLALEVRAQREKAEAAAKVPAPKQQDTAK